MDCSKHLIIASPSFTLLQVASKNVKSKLHQIPSGKWHLRVNSNKVQSVGQGQNLDRLRTPLIWTGWGHIVMSPYLMLYWYASLGWVGRKSIFSSSGIFLSLSEVTRKQLFRERRFWTVGRGWVPQVYYSILFFFFQCR